MDLESAERPESAWDRAERLEAALWVVGLFWGALVLAMAGLTQVSGVVLLIILPIAAVAGFSLCVRLHGALVRRRRRGHV